MFTTDKSAIINDYYTFLTDTAFPCVAAKAALTRDQVKVFVAGHMACPADDTGIVKFLYDFIDGYRNSDRPFHSAAVIFPMSHDLNEEAFEKLLWQRLQSISDIDASKYDYDKRVNSDPSSPDFSFSLKEEAFFIIGLHPASSRPARKFKYPALVFNPHAEFERLRSTGGYEKMKNIVRKKDMSLSGSLNPMLDDHGKTSEVIQYSGINYQGRFECPLKIKHGTGMHHSAT